MPVVYQGKELTLFKPKTGGKNQSPVDGFYENSNGERYFIKKPDNKVELFAELFAGLILKEFMKRKLIDTVYFPSLIVADDVVRFEDGTYGLIQPMVSFTQLHELIGTSFSDGKDRNSIKEALYGPQYYSALIQQQKYFGLSTALMFSLLLGAHSVHSGNVIALHNDKLLSRQYGRLDWGDAFRYFAHPENNNNLLFAYENRGWFNYKKLTKDYFLNYKLIPGLFPVMAEKGTSLVQQLQTNTLQDIVISALRNVPSDLIGHEIKNEFAHYTFMDSFKDVAFGPDSDGGQFAIDMANILKGRLEKITQLQDIISQTEAQTMYKSTISVPDPVLSVPQGTIFSDLLDKWNTLLLENKGAASIDTQQVNLSQLATIREGK